MCRRVVGVGCHLLWFRGGSHSGRWLPWNFVCPSKKIFFFFFFTGDCFGFALTPLLKKTYARHTLDTSELEFSFCLDR